MIEIPTYVLIKKNYKYSYPLFVPVHYFDSFSAHFSQALLGAPVLASSCPVSRPSPPFAAPRGRMQHPYVNESPSWGLTSAHTPVPAPVGPQASGATAAAAASGGQEESPLAVMAGLTRSHPNLVNDYVNLDPKSGSGVNPDRCQVRRNDFLNSHIFCIALNEKRESFGQKVNLILNPPRCLTPNLHLSNLRR